MNALENTYFDEYKRLDDFCKTLFGYEKGLSDYIQQMEDTPDEDAVAIVRFRQEQRTLKRLRYLRNRIAHEPGESGLQESDLKTLGEVYDRMLKGEDPISILHRYKKDEEDQKQRMAEKKAAPKTTERRGVPPAPSGTQKPASVSGRSFETTFPDGIAPAPSAQEEKTGRKTKKRRETADETLEAPAFPQKEAPRARQARKTKHTEPQNEPQEEKSKKTNVGKLVFAAVIVLLIVVLSLVAVIASHR